jgi:hypothetical protein
MARALVPGSRWVARTGKHAGGEVEITNLSDVSVFFINRAGGGDSLGNQKADDSKTFRLTRETFNARYLPREELVPGETHGGRAFRRQFTYKPEPEAVASRVQPPPLNGHILSGGTPLNLEVLAITPLQAQAWLDRGGLNRHPSRRRVQAYAAAMRRGEWILTGDSIKLDEQGVVRDGQQRLMAIVEAGVPITSLVVRNVSPSAFDVIDSGRPRGAWDVLGMHGFTNRFATAAATRGLVLIEHFGRFDVRTFEASQYLSTVRILAYAEAHRDELTEALKLAEHIRVVGHFYGGGGLWAILFALLLRANHDAAHLFAEALATGANLEVDSPILRLRSRMLDPRNVPNSVDERETALAIGIKAWNAWRAGERVEQLMWRGSRRLKSPESFPVAQ